ncbi:MAG: hypothetical protein ABSC23_00630 [Bryobacteraceae bacterium]
MLAITPDAVFYFCMFAEMGYFWLPYQRATPFEAALPISGRQLLAARLLTLLGILWVPILAGSSAILIARGASHAAHALGAVKAAAIATVAALALQSVRIKEIRGPDWLPRGVWFLALFACLAPFMDTVPVLAACAGLSTALLFRLWRVVPRSFQLAPAGPPAEADRARGLTARSVGGKHAASSYAWRPVLKSLHGWRSLLLIPWFANFDDWFVGFFFVLFIWQTARRQSRWLCALPIDARTVLLILVTPIFLLEMAGYFAGYLPPFQWFPTPVRAFPVQVVDFAVAAGVTLTLLLFNALYDWRALRGISSRVRAAALISMGIALVLYLHFKPALVQHAVRYVTSPGAVAVAAAVLAVLWWALDKVYREAEYTDNPHAPQSGYFGWRS